MRFCILVRFSSDLKVHWSLGVHWPLCLGHGLPLSSLNPLMSGQYSCLSLRLWAPVQICTNKKLHMPQVTTMNHPLLFTRLPRVYSHCWAGKLLCSSWFWRIIFRKVWCIFEIYHPKCLKLTTTTTTTMSCCLIYLNGCNPEKSSVQNDSFPEGSE